MQHLLNNTCYHPICVARLCSARAGWLEASHTYLLDRAHLSHIL